MRRRLLFWTSLLLSTALVLLSVAFVQAAGTPEPPVDNSERVPLLQYVFAIGSFLLVLLIVCRPSRKR
jgi:hypothetical protein